MHSNTAGLTDFLKSKPCAQETEYPAFLTEGIELLRNKTKSSGKTELITASKAVSLFKTVQEES